MRQAGLVAGCCAALSITAAAQGPSAPGGVVDLAGMAASLDLTETGVRRWLAQLGAGELGASDEQLMAVSLTGTPLLDRRGGSGSSVRLDRELDTLLREPDRSIVLIHNHPASGGLSAADIGQLAKAGVAAIVAVGHDGSVFAAAAGPQFDRDFFEARQHAVARAEVFKRLRADWPSGRLSVPVSDAHLSHLVTLALARANVVRYWFELRGVNRESFDAARLMFGRAVAGAADRLRKNTQRARHPGQALAFPAERARQHSTLPIAVPFEPAPSPYVVIRVPVAGGPCAALIFDTGTNTTLLAPALAARVGLTAGYATEVESLNRSTRATKGEVRGIGFDGAVPAAPRIAVSANVSALHGVAKSVTGIYGHNWLSGIDYVIDYEAKRIMMGLPALPPFAGRDRVPLSWIAERPAVAAVVRAHAVEPYTARFVLDSGADHVSVFGRAAKRLALAVDSGRTMLIDDGFARAEVPTASISLIVGGIERSVRAEIRSDITDREEDGLLPTSVFRQVLVSASEGVVVFNRRVPAPDGLAPQRPCAE